MFRREFTLAASCIAGVVTASVAEAASFVCNGSLSLSSPSNSIDLGDNLFRNGALIIDQFQSSGVLFEGFAKFDFENSVSVSQDQGRLGAASSSVATSVLTFDGPVTDVRFGWFSPSGARIETFLNGAAVDDFSQFGASMSTPGNFGVLDSRFDVVKLITGNAAQGAQFDILQLNVAAVPFPAALPMALGSLILASDRRPETKKRHRSAKCRSLLR